MRARRRLDDDVPLDEETQEDIITELQVEMMLKRQLYRAIFTVVMLIPTPIFIFTQRMRAHPVLAFQSLSSVIIAAFCLYKEKPQLNKINAGMAGFISFQAIGRIRPFIEEDIMWLVPVTSVVTCYILLKWFDEMQTEVEQLKKKRFKLKSV